MKYIKTWSQINETNKIFKDKDVTPADGIVISNIDDKSIAILSDHIGVTIQIIDSNFKYTPFEIIDSKQVENETVDEITLEITENTKIIGEETVFSLKTGEDVMIFYTDGTHIFCDDTEDSDGTEEKSDSSNDWIPE
jgi:hypothetical protein